jgi:hypothetical protein
MKEKDALFDLNPQSTVELDMVFGPTFEELESKIAPDALGVKLNHNETLLQDNS